MTYLIKHKQLSNNYFIINRKVQLFVLFISLLLPISPFAQTDEYTIKIVLLERFTRFIEWPEESAISDTSQPFVLGLIGKNPFGSKPEDIYSTRKMRNKKVKIRYISKLDEIEGCHLLFISKSEEKKLSKILSFTKDKPILTISDTKGFAEEGVLINLYLKEDKVQFEINESAVRESGLSMSYMLLKTGKIVNPAR